MISQVLSLWKTKNGLDSEGDYVYGIYNDIGFSINDEKDGKLLVISVIAGSTESYKKIQELCRLMGGCFSNIKIGRVEDYLALFIPDSTSEITVLDIDSIVKFVASNYSNAGFVAHTKCFKCGKPSDRLTFKDQLVRPICNSCASDGTPSFANNNNNDMNSLKQEPISQIGGFSYDDNGYNNNDNWGNDDYNADENYNYNDSDDVNFQLNDQDFDNSYNAEFDLDNSHHPITGAVIRGIIGSVLGAAIGVIPMILVFNFFGSAISACCICTSIVATLLYLLFHGPRSTGIGSVIILLCSALSSVVGTFYVLGKRPGTTGITDVFSHISSSDVAIQLVIAVVGSVLGFLVMIKVFLNYCHNK